MSYIFPLVFFISAFVSCFWGFKIIRLNKKSNINRLFLFVCLALSIWSLGFAMANLSQNLKTALLWRRFSAVGWTTIFSFILHYLLLITGSKDNRKLNKYVYLLYIPAIINLSIFAISNNMAIIQYNLVKINYGWTNRAVNNGWDYFYYTYYSIYMIISLIIVWQWKEKIKEKVKAKQAKLIFLAILFAAIFASLTDLTASTFLVRPLPQMAPLFILLPVWALFYPARYYELVDYDKKMIQEIIVTTEDKKKIFKNLSLAFYIAAILVFISEYIPYMNEKNALQLALVKALTLTILGITIRMIQNIKKETLRENLTIVVLVLSIPIATLQYVEYGGITVWAFPLVIIISSVIFSKLSLLISTTILTIITQILIWAFHPETTVVVDKYDYMLRIGMFIVAFLTALYINKMYVIKLKTNQYQMAFQKMVSEILFEFVSLKQENFDRKVNYLLEKIGVFFNVDRTYLFTINHQNNTMTYSNEWCNAGIKKELRTIEEMPLEVFPWWIDQLSKKKLVYIEDVDFMPKEAIEEQKQLQRQEVKSLLSVPVMGEEKIQAFIGMDSVLVNKKWSKEKIEMLNIMASILSNGMTQMESDQAIEFMAYYDNLTKLPNRFLFEDRVNGAIGVARETGKLISIIFIDLDNFKTVNDTIGHKGGDELLKRVARSLEGVVGETDMVARFGGDEFMIMINNITDRSIISQIADKIMELFSDLFIVSGQEFLITASAGIAIYPIDGEDSASLVKNADIAMYEAKAKGKNQYALCTKEIKDQIQMSMELSNDLNRALDRDEFVVYYQPQIDLSTNKIIGVEALLRWMHPVRGMISPGIFIPIAEENGLINNIGQWVLRAACMQNKKWQDMGLPHMVMAINLSGVQIINPKLVDHVEDIIKETGLEPKYIELEITESIAIQEADYIIDTLNKLSNIGISIAIDDFGTGYSSLSRLKMLPIDRVKIDMQFTQGIESNEKDRAITMVIINLAKNLGLNVLAEGVETAPQLAFLNQKMCEYAQGYYYYKPMPAKELEKILHNGAFTSSLYSGEGLSPRR